MDDKLVVYFSLTGNTRRAAKLIAARTGAKVLELQPLKPYSEGFSTYITGGFGAMFKRRPQLRPLAIDPVDFQTIFIGTPVWAGRIAPPLRTFLSTHDFSGKKLAMFCTCLDNAGRTFANIHELQPGMLPAGQIALNMKMAEMSLKSLEVWADEIGSTE